MYHKFISFSRSRKGGFLLFFLFLVILCIVYYDGVLDKGPLNTHLWRQADCLSMTKKYQEGAALHEPTMHVLFGDDDTSGKSAGEFPILYYTVGNLWKVTGESFLVYRLVCLAIMVLGMLAFFRSVQLVFKSNFWAFSLSVVMLSSPVLMFYSVSFLTDAPAFFMVLISLYFLVLYQLKGKVRWLYLFGIVMALAGLLKISALIAFVFIGFIFCLELIPGFKSLPNRKLFQDPLHGFVSLAIVVVSVVSWYLYAESYNAAHDFKYTFNHIFPFWKEDPEKLKHTWSNMKMLTIPVFYNYSVIFLLGTVFIWNLFLSKRIPLLAYLASIIVTLGAAMYFTLWGPLMGVHDYYYVALLVIVPAILGPFVYFLKTNDVRLIYTRVFRVVLGVFLVFNLIYCKEVLRFKTGRQVGESIFIQNDKFEAGMRWTNWRVAEHWNSLNFIRPHLEGMGVRSNDKVICFPDFSFNLSLFYLDRDGWTNFRSYDKSSDIEYLKSKGAKYLIIHEPELLDAEFIQPYISNKVGELKNVSVYKL